MRPCKEKDGKKQTQEGSFSAQGRLYREASLKDVEEKHETRELTDSVEVLTMVAHFLWSCRTAAGNSVGIGACWGRFINGGVLDLRS